MCHGSIRDSLRFGHPRLVPPQHGAVSASLALLASLARQRRSSPGCGVAASGAVAQWTERRRPKAGVAGSIPASPQSPSRLRAARSEQVALRFQAMIREFFQRLVSKQFGKPTGMFGRMIEKRMSKRTAGDARWTVSLLDVQPRSRVLEIGFGGGVSTQLASEEASEGFVAGIDHSATMVEVARERNADAIRAGRMELNHGDAASILYPDDSFDIVFSLHSIYFWRDPLECLKGFRRVLKPGGTLAITIQPRDRWGKEQIGSPGMTLFSGGQVGELFSSAGFQNVRTESFTENGAMSLQCILGTK